MSYSMSPPPPQKPSPAPYSSFPAPSSSTSPPNASTSPYGPPPAKRQRMSPDPRSPPNGTPSAGPPPSQPPSAGNYGNPYGPNTAVHSPYAPSPSYSHSSTSFNTPQPYPYSTPSPWQSQPLTPAPPPLQQSHTSPPSNQSREMMPPPPRPARDDRDEKLGVEDIGDSLFGSGINLKDEENYLQAMYSNRHHGHSQESSVGGSFAHSAAAGVGTSFGSSGTMSASGGNSFDLLTQATSFGSQEGALAGTLGRTRTEEDVELEMRRKREVAARELAERKQHHLNHQFLQCNNVRKRMDGIARNTHVVLNMTGVFIRQAAQDNAEERGGGVTNVLVNGTGNEGLVAAKSETPATLETRPESVVNSNTPFEQIVSLISLAAGERLRGLLDEAYTLVRARRYGDHGRVIPTEFADIAIGEGERSEERVPIAAEGITGSPWDATAEATENESSNGEKERQKSGTPQLLSTVSFAGTLNASLRTLAERDREAERARLAKREDRKRKAALALANPDTPDSDPSNALNTSLDSSGNANSTLGTAAGTGAEAGQKLTKKELLRQQKEKNSSTEAQMHLSTNQTAAMMALGKKGRRYDWMGGGAGAMPVNRFAKSAAAAAAAAGAATLPGTTGGGGSAAGSAAGSGTVTPAAEGKTATGPFGAGNASAVGVVDGTAGNAAASGVAADGKGAWGEWSEVAAREGIEMRDWVLVLERDGKEKEGLVKALARMG